MFVPIILGSDKTTVSVATGHNEYWPVYLSIGNIHNNVRRAHRNGLVLIAFLVIPKSRASLTESSNQARELINLMQIANKKHRNDAEARKFRRQLYHSSLAKI